ncbi:MAG TPA: C39 family peptidase, partial [Candidatus Limnocylindria bacterium]|nr:C39 family peptidase [Candidatus Limnocylindria bacterium]
MRLSRHAAVLVGAIALVMTSLLPGTALAKEGGSAGPNVAFTRASLSSGTHAGVVLSGTGLVLAAGGLASGTYADPFGHPPIAYESGTWIGAWTSTPFSYDELVASWNAETPAGTWVRIEMQGRGSGRETKLYTLGIWASGDGDIHRTSVSLQGDGDGFIAIDTFVRGRKALPLDGYRLQVTLYRRAGTGTTPTLRAVGAMVSAAPSKWTIPSATTRTERRVLAVPEYSQETHIGHFPEYDNGGEAWCSPTSTAMVLRFWGTGPDAAALAAFPGSDHLDGQVDHAARYVYDWNYNGAGNWPYNTA